MQVPKRNKTVRYLLTIALVIVACYCVLALLFPDHFVFTTSEVQHFSLIFLLLAIIALFFNENKLLWISMGCSALLSFMVYQSRLKPMPDPPRKQIMPYLNKTLQENEPAPINK